MKRLWILAACGVFWAGCKGAEETPPADGAASGGESASATAASHEKVQAIFNAKCVFCHGENGKDGVDLRTYASTMKGGEEGAIVKAGDPAGSKIVEMIKAEPPKRMPKNSNPLPAEEIKLIEDWIAAGAKEG